MASIFASRGVPEHGQQVSSLMNPDSPSTALVQLAMAMGDLGTVASFSSSAMTSAWKARILSVSCHITVGMGLQSYNSYVGMGISPFLTVC